MVYRIYFNQLKPRPLKGITAINTTSWSCLAVWSLTDNSFAVKSFGQKPRVNIADLRLYS